VLMARGGTYARLFSLQARGFSDTPAAAIAAIQEG
jgi:hypothetical protein